MTRILVTGANGFIGGAVCAALAAGGHEVVAAVRKRQRADQFQVGDLSGATDWRPALQGCTVAIHLAARVHMLKESAADPLAAFREVNVTASVNLARQAAASGVRRLVFVSSIGVNGAETVGAAFSETSPIHPHSPYAISKAEAESALTALCAELGMELVVIRPPLVYDYRAPGNFATLLKIIGKRMPLPLASVRNRRSMVSLDNLLDFIEICAFSKNAANQLFLVADREAVSTPALLRLLMDGMGKQALLLPCPVGVLKLGAAVVGKMAMFQQLCGSLEIDASKAHDLLGWTPPVTVYAGLRGAARQYGARTGVITR